MGVAGPRQEVPGAEHVRAHLDKITQEIDHRYDHLAANAKKLGQDDFDSGDHDLVPTDCHHCQSFPIEQSEIGRCTSTACHIAKPLKGKVMGYHHDDNPSALSEDAGGHDFAVIGGRYIADWWAGSYHDVPDLWDMKNPTHMNEVRRLYGDPDKWTQMYDFEKQPDAQHSWEAPEDQGWVKKAELAKATPVSRIKLPDRTPQASAPAPKPSAIGQGERDVRAGKVSGPPVGSDPVSPGPSERTHMKPIEYGQFVLPAKHHAEGYRVQAFEGSDQTKIFFTGPKGQHFGTAHLEHPEGNPDAAVSHRFEMGAKVGAQHHKTVTDYLARAVRHHLYGPPAAPIKKNDSKRHGDWLGRPVVHPKDGDLLEMNAAIHEFQGKVPRGEAEERAHGEYRREHHLDGAAHHLMGIKIANTAQQSDDAQKHGAMYALHMRALGHDPHSDPPGEVKSRLKGEKQKLYRFRAHKADLFVVDKQDDLKKHEMDLTVILRKGDVIDFPGNKAPAQDQGKPAEVTGIMKPKLGEIVNAPPAKPKGQHMFPSAPGDAPPPKIEKPDAPVIPFKGATPPSGLASMAPSQAWDALIAGHHQPDELSDDHLLGLMAWNDPNGEWENIRSMPQKHGELQRGLQELTHHTGRQVHESEVRDHLHDLAFGDEHPHHISEKALNLLDLHKQLQYADQYKMDRGQILEAFRGFIADYQPVSE